MSDDIRTAQMLQLKLAKEVKRICEKHNIQYFLMAGSLLGAIRHGGFIPWDDDLDIGMVRKEYDKFVEIIQTELNEEFFFQTWHTDKNYAYPFGKLMLKNTTWVEAVAEYADICHGVYIDIFPYDEIPSSEKSQKSQKLRNAFYRQVMLAKDNYNTSVYKSGLKSAVSKIIKLVSFVYPKEFVISKYEDLIAEGLGSNSGVYYAFGIPYSYLKGQMKKEWLENFKYVKFEDDYFPVPSDYDGYLSFLYGDYMTPPPPEKRVNYHRIVKKDFGKYVNESV